MRNLESMENSGNDRMSTLEKIVAVTAMGVGTVVTGGLTVAGVLSIGYGAYLATTAASEGKGYAAAGAVGLIGLSGLLTFMGGRGLRYFIKKIPQEIRYMREH